MSFANNAATTLASSITNVATSLTVASGTGTLFPTLTGSQYFYCTLENSAGTSREIVKVTARSTDTFTITRAQDGTTGTAFSAGDKVELRLVRANLTDFPLLDEANTFAQQQTFSSGIKFNDATTQTTAAVTSTYAGGKGQAFTSSGTFTIPAGVTAIKITAVGGGGGGYGAAFGHPGSAGGNTTIASGTQSISTITAGGGSSGNYTSGGSGGSGSGGAINIAGFSGQSGGYTLLGYGLNGLTGVGYGIGGVGGSGSGGSGGNSIAFLTGLTPSATLSITVGAGGAGGTASGCCGPGASGSQGIVLIEW